MGRAHFVEGNSALADSGDLRKRDTQFAHLSGVQTTIQFLVETLRADARAGLRTAAFVSGYQGSPLAGFDLELQRAAQGLDVEIIHQPAVNEELGATAVMGSQLTAAHRPSRYDGVLGIWYGKAPGLDRSIDALRHANYAGASPHGGAIALVGDDPAARSSTLPSASEAVLADLGMPIMFPRTLADILELGQHAVALSRYSGSWVAMKLVTDVADAEGSVAVDQRLRPVIPDSYVAPEVTGDLLTPATLDREPDVLANRLAAAARYGDANHLNRLVVDSARATLSIVAAGTVFSELLEALRLLGLDADSLEDLGIRVGEIRMPYPLSLAFADEIANDVDDVIVVEERRQLIEHQLLSLIIGKPQRPRVWGRLDPNRTPFIPPFGTLDAATLARLLHPVLASRLGTRVSKPAPEHRLIPVASELRVPWFCPGCPHSASTAVPEGTLVGAGIGCHSIVRFMPEDRVGRSIGITQMGGEGAQWIGMAPFLDESHIVQNMGDGTFFHSGQLAVRGAVAAGVTMTFKILWNGSSAMTGGQHIEGSMSILDAVRLLRLDGVKQVVITTDDVGRYRKRRLGPEVSVRPRRDILAVQSELAGVDGVTVMIHDQVCATELRRARKRGSAAEPRFKVVINERVCEGCGDCQRKSNCLSLQMIDTPFGPKTWIDQDSCNVDLSCLEGDCPAFAIVEVAGRGANPVRPMATTSVWSGDQLPNPAIRDATSPVTIRIAGIGGSGVVTAAHLLARAAMLDGMEVWGVDETGLSQKAGAVVSDLRIGTGSSERAQLVGSGEVDLLLAADLIAATRPSILEGCSSERTSVVGSSSTTLSGPMILGTEERHIPVARLCEALTGVSRRDRATFVDAKALAKTATANSTAANVALLGVACQLGELPVREGSVEKAIEQNGVAVSDNLAAFRWGRTHASRLEGIEPGGASEEQPTRRAARPDLRLAGLADLPVDQRSHLTRLVAELVAYQNHSLATRFIGLLSRTWDVERTLNGDGTLTVAVSDGAFKLLAYKDEYEVARLLLDEPAVEGRTTWLLHPPTLRSRGVNRKLRFGPWARPALVVLRSSRHVRGTRFDVFGRTDLRKLERALIEEYFNTIKLVLRGLRPDNHPDAISIALLPLRIRGFEDVKIGSIREYRHELAKRMADF